MDVTITGKTGTLKMPVDYLAVRRQVEEPTGDTITWVEWTGLPGSGGFRLDDDQVIEVSP